MPVEIINNKIKLLSNGELLYKHRPMKIIEPNNK